MALFAKLQFGDNIARRYMREYRLTDCHWHFARHYNNACPETDARVDSVEISIAASDASDLSIYDWYIGQEGQNCRIVYYFADFAQGEANPVREIQMENAICFALAEEYSNDHKTRRVMRLSVAPEEITLNNYTFIQ